jgi:hypothetical protein
MGVSLDVRSFLSISSSVDRATTEELVVWRPVVMGAHERTAERHDETTRSEPMILFPTPRTGTRVARKATPQTMPHSDDDRTWSQRL